eukprot:gene7804-8650_t
MSEARFLSDLTSDCEFVDVNYDYRYEEGDMKCVAAVPLKACRGQCISGYSPSTGRVCQACMPTKVETVVKKIVCVKAGKTAEKTVEFSVPAGCSCKNVGTSPCFCNVLKSVPGGIILSAWTFVPVCNNEYPSHGYFQVGLFDGAPTVEIINSLENQPLFQTITNLRKRKIVKVVDRASVFVRIGDARRREELENVNKLTVRKNFLPRGTKFTTLVSSRQFATIIPANQNRDDYGNVLAGKFRMLVDQVFQQRS